MSDFLDIPDADEQSNAVEDVVEKEFSMPEPEPEDSLRCITNSLIIPEQATASSFKITIV